MRAIALAVVLLCSASSRASDTRTLWVARGLQARANIASLTAKARPPRRGVPANKEYYELVLEKALAEWAEGVSPEESRTLAGGVNIPLRLEVAEGSFEISFGYSNDGERPVGFVYAMPKGWSVMTTKGPFLWINAPDRTSIIFFLEDPLNPKVMAPDKTRLSASK